MRRARTYESGLSPHLFDDRYSRTNYDSSCTIISDNNSYLSSYSVEHYSSHSSNLENYDNSTLQQGFLYKRGMRSPVWQSRWCVLEGKYLRYFISRTSKKPRRSIDMTEARVHQEQSKTKMEFQIQLCKRTYFFKTESTKDKFRWLVALRAASKIDENHSHHLEGLLEKRGVYNVAWKARWCVFDGRYIKYFANKSSTSPRGTIDLFSAKIFEERTKNDMEFQVHVPQRIYFLKAHDMEDKYKWMKALIKATHAQKTNNHMTKSVTCPNYKDRVSKVDKVRKFLKLESFRSSDVVESKLQNEIDTLTFSPNERLGFGFEGNCVRTIALASQAHKAGVCIGWKILSINGGDQPDATDAIMLSLNKARKEGKPIVIRFSNDEESRCSISEPHKSMYEPSTGRSSRDHRLSKKHVSPILQPMPRAEPTWEELGYPVDEDGMPDFVIWNSSNEIKHMNKNTKEKNISQKSRRKLTIPRKKGISYLQK